MKLKATPISVRAGAGFSLMLGTTCPPAESQRLALAFDETLIAVCAAEGLARVTVDTDFANAMRYPPARYA